MRIRARRRDGSGDLGLAGPGTFVPEFDTAIADLSHNEIFEPFKSRYGWHIVNFGHAHHGQYRLHCRRGIRRTARAMRTRKPLVVWRRLRYDARRSGSVMLLSHLRLAPLRSGYCSRSSVRLQSVEIKMSVRNPASHHVRVNPQG